MPGAVARPAPAGGRAARAVRFAASATWHGRAPGRRARSAPGPGRACAAPRCTRRWRRGRARPGCRSSRRTVRDASSRTTTGVRAAGLPARYLVAADGLHSPVRPQLGLRAAGARRPRATGCAGTSRRAVVRPSSRCTGPTGRGVRDAGGRGPGRGRRPGRRAAALRRPAGRVPRAGRSGWRGPGDAACGAPARCGSGARAGAGRVLLVGDAPGTSTRSPARASRSGSPARAAVAAVVAGPRAPTNARWRRLSWRHNLLTHVAAGAPAGRPVLRRGSCRRPSAAPWLFRAAVNAAGEAGMNGPSIERVVLLDEDGHASGDGRQARGPPRRDPAAPGVLPATSWTRTAACSSPDAPCPRPRSRACGPTPAADTRLRARTVEDAVVRRVRQELGLSLSDLRLVLPRFRYRAGDGLRRRRERDVPRVRRDVRGRRTCRSGRGRGAPLGALAGVPSVVRAGRPRRLVVVPRAGRRAAGRSTRRAGTVPLRAASGRAAVRYVPGYRRPMTTTPREPDPDAPPLDTDDDGDPGASPIPGEKQTPGADS